ncbi:MAG: FlgD immunoglobulin-like domain containing protein [bacterium]|nr:FlgD immunoglobulin-like domain containing protein [bacterium]
MKAKIGFIIGILLVVGIGKGFAITDSTVVSGGNWNDSTTWVGYHIPNKNDDVILKGTVIADGYYQECNNLTVRTGTILQNVPGYGTAVQAMGDVTNNGTIKNNPTSGNFTLYVKGNLVNNGTMTQNLLSFNDSLSQHIGGTQKFDCILINKNPYGHLIASSDLVFDTLTTVDLYCDTLDMGTYKLTARSTVNANFRYGAISSSGEIDVSGPFGCNLIGNITLTGTQPIQIANIGVSAGGKWAKGNLTIASGKILEVPNYNHYYWQVLGSLTNNGTIRNNPAGTQLKLYITENLVNNGVMTQQELGFNGDSTNIQHIGGTQKFDCILINKNPYGHLIASSDLVFDTLTTVDLYCDTLDMGTYKLTARSTVNANFRYGAISSSGEIDVSGPFGCNLIGNITLTGTQPIQIANIGVSAGGKWAKGNLTIASGKILEVPNYNHYYWQVLGSLTNNGTIRNNPAGTQLSLRITENLINNGVMTQQELLFNGDSTNVQHIGGTQKFDCILINKNPYGHLIASNDLVFDTLTTVDLYCDTLDMGTYKLTARSTVNANFRYGAISSSGEIDVSGPFGCNLIGNITLTGSQPMQIANIGSSAGGKTVWGNIIIDSGKILEVPDYNRYSLGVTGNLINNGTIRNNPASNYFDLSIGGNIFNNGVWTNNENTICGDSNQFIYLVGNKKIRGRVWIQAVKTGNTFQWFKNDSVFAGKISSYFYWDSLTQQEYGQYKCKIDDSLYSRIITIGNGTGIEEGTDNAGNTPKVYNFQLSNISPNPTISNTSISFGIPYETNVKIKVYNCLGSEVKTLVNSKMVPGYHTIKWNGRDTNGNKIASGIYFCKMESGNFKATRKLTIID